MNEHRCTICGSRKATSVPYPLCPVHAEELYRSVVQSSLPPKTERPVIPGVRAYPPRRRKYLTERDRLDAHNARRRQR